MRDELSIGPVPSDKACQQVGTSHYDPTKARSECRRFIQAIRIQCGNEPEGATLRIKSNPHDFGSYLEVVVQYEEDNEAAVEYAFKVEGNAPTEWPTDEEVQAYLASEDPEVADALNNHGQ
jgi:hypothetical protein